MKKTILFLLMTILLVFSISAEFDYMLGQEYAQVTTEQLWIEGANGLIRENGGQTFTAPYTLNITGFKFKSSGVTDSGNYANITTYIATIKEDNTPNVSTLVGKEFISSFSTGWNTWTFDTPYQLTEGVEYAIWWQGDVIGGAGTNKVDGYLTNVSVYDYTGGGELFRNYYYVWTYADDNDFVMNLTFFGDEPCVEDWQPYYTACSIGDNHTLYYLDNNTCGTTDNLPVDNSTISSCNYCAISYTTQDTICQPDYTITTYSTYNNFETCCNVTGIPADCELPDEIQTPCVEVHEVDDISGLVIDFGVEYGRQMILLAGLIAMLCIAYYTIKKVKDK